MRLEPPRARGPRLGITAIIDVVFLLLLFFMLASTFGRFAEVELSLAGGGTENEGPAVVLTVEAGGDYRVDGARVDADRLAAALARALPDGEGRIVLRAADDASAQDIVAAVERARASDVAPVVLAR